MIMLRKFLFASAWLLAAGLAGCGGGSGGSQLVQPTPPTEQSTPVGANSKITLIADGSTLLTDGASTVKFTATIKHSTTNAALQGVDVNFAATSGTLSAGKVTSDANGEAVVVLNSNDDKSNRASVTVTANVTGGPSATNSISVSGTTLNFAGATSAVINKTASVAVNLADGGNKPIGNTPIVVKSALTGATQTITTAANGQATLVYQATVAGTETLTATALGVSRTQSINISTVSLDFTNPAANANIALGSGCQAVSAQLGGGADASLTFSINRGLLYKDAACATAGAALQSAAMDGTGTATVYARSPSAGKATISVQAINSQATTSVPVNFVSVAPASITVQAQPSTVIVGSDSTVTAFVSDAAGNPVEGQTVYFSVPNGGGVLSPGYAQTNAAGVASTVFTADSSMSGLNAVTLNALVGSLSATTYITVSGQGVQVALGTDNTIYTDESNGQIYRWKWLVGVRDTNGSPVQNQLVTVSLGQPYYEKGYYTWVDADSLWKKLNAYECPSEDIYGNGVYSAAQDTNHNGKLDPQYTVVLVPATGSTGATQVSVKTDSLGYAVVWIQQAKSETGWVKFRLTATAVVNGVNNTAVKEFYPWVPANDLTTKNTPPPFVVSPSGAYTGGGVLPINPCSTVD